MHRNIPLQLSLRCSSLAGDKGCQGRCSGQEALANAWDRQGLANPCRNAAVRDKGRPHSCSHGSGDHVPRAAIGCRTTGGSGRRVLHHESDLHC